MRDQQSLGSSRSQTRFIDDSSKIRDLEAKIERLQWLVSKINDSMSWGNSVVKVVFRDESYSAKYKSKIKAFLEETLGDDENFIINCKVYDDTEKEYNHLEASFDAERKQMRSDTYQKKNSDSKRTPIYIPDYVDVMHGDKIVEEKPVDPVSQGLSCFNCLGDHHMKDCPHPINRAKVAENKKALTTESTSRYHIEEQRNSIKPGNISAELRDALRLRDNQLPPYIYAMRLIGYPPGWKQETLVETSGIALYDKEGNCIDDVDSSSSEGTGKYDSSKLVEFPGFNCPVPENCNDEWKKYGSIPMQSQHQLSETRTADEMIDTSSFSKRKSTNECDDEKQAKKLKGEPEDQDLDSSKEILNDSSQEEIQVTPSVQDMPSKGDTPMTTVESLPPPPLSRRSISQSPGTPILAQGNRFRRLPDAGNFAQGITEHLPFENLPDAVGKYDTMRKVLATVQKKLQNISTNKS